MNGKTFEAPENFRKYLLQVNIRCEINTLIKSLNYSAFIKRSAEEFSENYQKGGKVELILKPIILCFVLNFPDIRSPLLEFLCEEPNQFKNVFKEVVFRELIKEINEGENRPRLAPNYQQLHLFIRIKEFPLEEKLKFDSSNFSIRAGLSILHCVLSGFVVNEKSILQSTWVCSNLCIGNTITTELEHAPFCPTCGVVMKEYTTNRYMCDKTILKVYPAQSFKTHRVSGKIIRLITVELLRDLCDSFLVLGGEYKIIGVYAFQNQIFKAWGISNLN